MLASQSICGLGNRFAAALATGLLLVGGMNAETALGQIKKPRSFAAQANSQPIAQLQSIRALLHQADHDYKGHRVAAVHQITEAIRALEGNKTPHKLPPKPAGAGSHKGSNEAQAASDAQLSQALQQLQALQAQLGSTRSRRVSVANGHISRAIQDLETALKIK